MGRETDTRKGFASEERAKGRLGSPLLSLRPHAVFQNASDMLPEQMAPPQWFTLIDEGRIDELRTLQFDVNETWVWGDLG